MEIWVGVGLSGAHAIYLGKQGKANTLTSVPLHGGSATTLLCSPTWPITGFDLSPARDEVAFLRRLDGGQVQIMTAQLAAGAAPAKALQTSTSIQSPSSVDSPRFVPDGRGLLWFGSPSLQLHYIPRGGGAATQLGRFEEPWLSCDGYLVDASSKLALFNSPGGVRLALLPR